MALTERLRRQPNSDSLRSLTVQIEQSLYEWVEELSQAQGISKSAIVSQLVRAMRNRGSGTRSA